MTPTQTSTTTGKKAAGRTGRELWLPPRLQRKVSLMPRHYSRVWPAVFLGPALVLMTLIGIYPLLYSLFASFQRLELPKAH